VRCERPWSSAWGRKPQRSWMARRSSKITAPRLARSGVLNPLHTTTEREVRFDILLSLKREDSYGLPLVLRDGFGGFLPQPPSFSEGQRRGFTFGLSAHRSFGHMDFRMTDSEKQEAFYPRPETPRLYGPNGK